MIRGARSRPRGQGGTTLVELLLVVSVSSLVVLPLLAWMVSAIGLTGRVERASGESRDQNLLSLYLTRDVASSTQVETTGSDCTGGRGDGGELVLRVTVGQATPTVAVYSVVPDTEGVDSLWRRVCGPDGATSSASRLVEGAIAPPAGWAGTVACTARRAYPGEQCGRVTMTLPMADGQHVRASASRRIGVAR